MAHIVSKVVKVNSTDTASQLLELGWELITTHTRLLEQDGQSKPGDEYVCFILGWPRALGEPKQPKLFDKDGTDA
jgi:hypothetical protein